MDRQNTESFKAFPGVRINVSDTGISTTVSAASLRMSLNARGFAKPEDLHGAKEHQMPCVHAEGAEDFDFVKHYERLELPHHSCVRSVSNKEEVKSADVRELTSPGLATFKEILFEALHSRDVLLDEIEEAKTQGRCLSDRISRLENGDTKNVADGSVAELWREAAAINERVEGFEKRLRGTYVATSIAVSDEAAPLFETMCHSFAVMAANSVAWDVVSKRNERRSRIDFVDSADVDRMKVVFREDKFDILECRWNVPRLQNINGGDLFIYPGFLVCYTDDKNFSVIEFSEMAVDIRETFFLEKGDVPANTVTSGVVQRIHADYESSADGSEGVSRDLPICKYASVRFSSKGGLNEEYLISNFTAAKQFCGAFSNLIAHFTVN